MRPLQCRFAELRRWMCILHMYEGFLCAHVVRSGHLRGGKHQTISGQPRRCPGALLSELGVAEVRVARIIFHRTISAFSQIGTIPGYPGGVLTGCTSRFGSGCSGCAMAALISQFISHAASTFLARNAQNLVASLPISPGHPFWAPLAQALSSVRLLLLSGVYC